MHGLKQVHSMLWEGLRGAPLRTEQLPAGHLLSTCPGLHLATWGEVDAKGDRVSMWLGFPAASLSRLGLKGLPREAMLPIAVQGSLRKPHVNWLE